MGERGYVSSRLHGFTSKEQALFTVLSVTQEALDFRVQRGEAAGHGAGSLHECSDNNVGTVRIT